VHLHLVPRKGPASAELSATFIDELLRYTRPKKRFEVTLEDFRGFMHAIEEDDQGLRRKFQGYMRRREDCRLAGSKPRSGRGGATAINKDLSPVKKRTPKNLTQVQKYRDQMAREVVKLEKLEDLRKREA